VKKHLSWIICVSFGFTLACNRAGQPNPEAAEASIRQQITKYTGALNAADTALAAQVWDTAGDISFISPAGHQHGWEEIKGVYEFFGSSFKDRKLTVRDISVHVLGDAAWAEFYWHFDAKQSDGTPMQSDGRESQVYRKDGDRWALVHVHYSGPAMTFPAP
jgi:ketosteroid isomerase-like protein